MGYMALKLDMSKVYDQVEWVFLEKIMLKMGFSVRWVNLILTSIKSVTYSIMLNGQPHGLINPERGIRQGDPLSLYLFLLVTEGLHALFKKGEDDGLQGVSLFVLQDLRFPTFYLQMIALCSVRQLYPNVSKFNQYFTYMNKPLVRV